MPGIKPPTVIIHPSCLVIPDAAADARCGPILSLIPKPPDRGPAEMTLGGTGRMTSLISAGGIVSRQKHCPYRQRETESGWAAGAIHAGADAWTGLGLGDLRDTPRGLAVGGRAGIVAGLGEFVTTGVGLGTLGPRPQVGTQLSWLRAASARCPLRRGGCATHDCCLC